MQSEQQLFAAGRVEQTPGPKYSQFFQLKRPLDSIQKPTRLHSVCSTNSANLSMFKIQSLQSGEEQEWTSFFAQAKRFHVTVFEMNSTQMPLVIDYLSAIQFTNLRDLSLYGNRICSLQNFYKIDLPKLKTLRIDQNAITNLRSLKKCSLPLLQQIDMQNNEWSEPQWLAEMHAPTLFVVRLQDWTHNYPRNDDKKWFAKLQTPQLNYIRCPSSRRMRQSAVDEMLKRKYPKLNVMRNNSAS